LKCRHAPKVMMWTCNICNEATRYHNLDMLQEWVEEQLRANPPINERFKGYRQALNNLKDYLKVKAVEE